MLFDSLADKMIWLMLVSDRKNRNKIIECINIIPPFVIEQIVMAFQAYNASNDSVCVSGVASVCEGTLNYNVSINKDIFKLRLIKSSSSDNMLKEIYELGLILFNNDMIEWRVSGQIGEFKFERCLLDNDSTFKTDETFNSYYMRNTSVGLMISNEDSIIPTRVSLDKLLDSANISHFTNKSNKNTLVRRRIMGSKN